MTEPDHKTTPSSALSEMIETIVVVTQALLIALVVRSFLFQPFNIPSGSMIPTLLVGDYLFVSKYSYGFPNIHFLSVPICSRGGFLVKSLNAAMSLFSNYRATIRPTISNAS